MSPTEPVRALGLMSGTSLDGIDGAIVDTDGEGVVMPGAWLSRPYEPALRTRIRGVLGGRGDVAGVARALTLAHADVVEALLAAAGLDSAQVGVIGFHGQTILHEPAAGRTWQIGDGALLAARTGIPVVDDFRSADMAAGGEGAPLAPLFHAALARGTAGEGGPLAILNIGGVANVTWIEDPALGVGARLVAFDTGPGNALIDDWVRARAGLAFDEDGALAGAGNVDERALAALLENGYFDRQPPKSLDRDAFDLAVVGALTPADGAATLTAFTAAAVGGARAHLPAPPARWLVTGGGRRNPAMMAALADRLGAPVDPVEAVGWEGDALEAQAFAFLAVRAVRGLPLGLPETTGVARPVTGGRLHPAPGR